MDIQDVDLGEIVKTYHAKAIVAIEAWAQPQYHHNIHQGYVSEQQRMRSFQSFRRQQHRRYCCPCHYANISCEKMSGEARLSFFSWRLVGGRKP